MTWRNNAPTMTPQEIALWEQRVRSGRLIDDKAGTAATRKGDRTPVELPDGWEHGAYSAYIQKRCRCHPCTDANVLYHRAKAKRRRAVQS